MDNFKEKEYKVFEIFDKQWAIVTAGSLDHYNNCTISWGSLGNIWAKSGKSISTVTIYVHPARYTSSFLKESDIFTVSFFPETYKKALGYIGSHSRRDGNKTDAAGLTPIAIGNGVTYKEATLTFVCKKIYQHQFTKEDIAPEVQDYYASRSKIYPDFKGGWQPHIVFMGEILGVIDQ